MPDEESTRANPRATSFIGGRAGSWSVASHRTLIGPSITSVERVDARTGIVAECPPGAAWSLFGLTTNDRYTTRVEKAELVERQRPIGRPEATCAALILLRKTADWWAVTQDERREILEEDSHHIAIGLRYLPAIARRLLHCRDIGVPQPFDFLGFLDYAPANAGAFEEMIGLLRSTREWTFMDREIDIRLVKDDG